MATRIFRAGAAGTDTIADVVCLKSDDITAASHYDTLRQAGAQYQVPVGKTLYITKIRFYSLTAGQGIIVGYGDTAVADSAAAPTTPVKMTHTFRAPAGVTDYDFDCQIAVPAQKFPFLASVGAVAAATMYGVVI